MTYYAHISKDSLRRQTVAEHCRGTARYAAECLAGISLSKTAYLAGLLHDSGKLTQEFQTYLESAAQGEAVRRGSVVHTFAGVRFLMEQYHGAKPDTFDDITCELQSPTPFSACWLTTAALRMSGLMALKTIFCTSLPTGRQTVSGV